MWQMDSYLSSRYIRWLLARPWERYVDWVSAVPGAVALLLPAAVGAAAWIGYCGYRLAHEREQPAKKPLDYTARARRTLWTARLLLALLALVAFLLPPIAVGVLLLHAHPWAVLLANQILRPYHTRVNRGFIRRASARLAELHPVVIGVAGSYGKTSTKYFLDVLLAEKFNCLKSPGNYNTLLGITRVVNDTLKPEHQVLIAEMGAYQRGEVKEIADLVHPRIGIITSIGPEHFERFRSIENIEQTNYELIASLPAAGLAVFNGDNEHCRKLAAATGHCRVALYSADNAHGDADIWAKQVQLTRQGIQLTLVTADRHEVRAETPVAGRHMLLNILGAARIALEMGVPLEVIGRALSNLRPAPHRLEIKPGAGGTTIIDDSYNSNPVGATEALRVLAQFSDGRRILVTPGMIELGELHLEKNEEFGYQASQSCDFVILVGPEQTRPIQQGLRRGKFPAANLRVIKDLSETQQIFQQMLRPGDVILFENDLPDLYTEK
jgi:UDP-N-acetylmuramoyl-tripeptide--D-alanyl-D-alanine ligase